MITWLASVALAGSVFVNGVNVDSLRNTTFENVTVTIDADGNLQIDAPNYKIEVVDPAAVGGAPMPAAPVPPAQTPGQAAVGTQGPPPPQPMTAQAPPTSEVAVGQWWLISEDNGSAGHTVHAYINGVRVAVVQSGSEPFILDIGPWLRRGPNTVEVKSNSQNAGGGPLYVYLGPGSNESGTVYMDRPEVQFGLSPNRSGPYSRTYQVSVP